MNYDKQEVNLREYQGVAIRRTDPFGFWVVEHPRLKLHKYTNIRDAQVALEFALAEQPTGKRKGK